MTTEAQTPALAAEAEGETALERAPKYDPLAPVGNPSTLKTLLERNSGAIAELLPKHVTPARLIKTMLVAVNRNPALLRCTTSSIFETIQRAAELGLDLSGTLGEAYPVPFKNKVKLDGREIWVDQCQLIPGYRGLAKLARQSGEIGRMEAEIVCENDHFRYEKGIVPVVEFRPLLTGSRGAVLGAYALAEVKGCGYQADWMTKEEIEKVRAISKSKDGPAWRNHWEEMAKKTVFRRLAKWLPLSAEKAGAFIQALEQDGLDFEFGDVAGDAGAAEINGGSRTSVLAAKLQASVDANATAPEDEVQAAPEVDEAAEDLAGDPETGAEADPDVKLAPGTIARFRGLCDKHGISPATIEEFFGEGFDGMPASMAAQVEAEILTRAASKKGGRK